MRVKCLLRTSALCEDYVDCGQLENAKCCFEIPAPLTLGRLRQQFPLDGDWHFRVKVSGRSLKLSTEGHVWQDLTDPDQVVAGGSDEVEILALALSLPALNETEGSSNIQQFLDGVSGDMGDDTRKSRHSDSTGAHGPKKSGVAETFGDKLKGLGVSEVGDKLKNGVTGVFKKITTAAQKAAQSAQGVGGGGMSIESVASGAASLWSSITKQTLGIFGQGTALSDVAESNLADLSELLGTVLDLQNKEHHALLRDVWDCLFHHDSQSSEVAFSVTGDKWKEAGFQKADPSSDLKNSGILSLRGVLHMGLNYPKRTFEMVEANKTNTKTKYPFAIVVINITLMLTELLHLRDNGYMSLQGIGYWDLFEDPCAFYEIFCMCFFHMNGAWTQRQAVRTDFGKLIGEMKGIVANTLARTPSSIMDFRMIAIDEGLLYDAGE